MVLLDFLFKICLAPVAEHKEKGKAAAVVFLTPPLSLLAIALINVLLYWLRPLINVNGSPELTFVIGCVTAGLVIWFLNRRYVSRDIGLGKNYNPFVGLLIPFLIFGSLIVFVMSLRFT